MIANVVGMSQHADGGLLATKPYAAGGAYINRMSDYCGGCRYDPRKRPGGGACPHPAGDLALLHRLRPPPEGQPRMRPPLPGLDPLEAPPLPPPREARRGTPPPPR